MADEKIPKKPVSNRPGIAGPGESGPNGYILCPDCRENIRDENEAEKVVMGHMKLPGVRCDHCEKPLPVGSVAAAITYWSRPEHYEPWEHGYLTTQ